MNHCKLIVILQIAWLSRSYTKYKHLQETYEPYAFHEGSGIMWNGDEIQICWLCIVLNILTGNQATYINKFFNIFVHIWYNSEKLFQEHSKDEWDSFGFDVKFIEWKNYSRNIHILSLAKYILNGWICMSGSQLLQWPWRHQFSLY